MTDTTTATAPAYNALRLIDDGERLAIHRVAIDDAGAVIAWEPEPVRLEVPSGGGDLGAATNALWRISSLAHASANCTYVMVPRLLLRDGKLIDLPAYGGEDAEPVRVMIAA